MREILILLCAILPAVNASAQAIDKIAGSYIKIDSLSSSYEKNGIWYKDIDTTQLILNSDMTFSYKWSPMFGAYSGSHILTTGAWKIKGNKISLNSKYQEDEYRVIENYRPEYGDSLVKIYVQTYDSLIGFFQMQFIGVVKGTAKESKMIFKDKEYPYNACSAVFHFSLVDKIVFYGDFGRMPVIIPRDKKSNHFLLQYNLSDNWDYQYFKDFEIKIIDNKAILRDDKVEKIILIKM